MLVKMLCWILIMYLICVYIKLKSFFIFDNFDWIVFVRLELELELELWRVFRNFGNVWEFFSGSKFKRYNVLYWVVVFVSICLWLFLFKIFLEKSDLVIFFILIFFEIFNCNFFKIFLCDFFMICLIFYW